MKSQNEEIKTEALKLKNDNLAMVECKLTQQSKRPLQGNGMAAISKIATILPPH